MTGDDIQYRCGTKTPTRSDTPSYKGDMVDLTGSTKLGAVRSYRRAWSCCQSKNFRPRPNPLAAIPIWKRNSCKSASFAAPRTRKPHFPSSYTSERSLDSQPTLAVGPKSGHRPKSAQNRTLHQPQLELLYRVFSHASRPKKQTILTFTYPK